MGHTLSHSLKQGICSLVLVVSMIMVVLILGGTTLFICGRFKKSVKKIPYEILFCGGTMYIDGRSFGGANIGRILMTPERGDSRGDMRRLVIYKAEGLDIVGADVDKILNGAVL